MHQVASHCSYSPSTVSTEGCAGRTNGILTASFPRQQPCQSFGELNTHAAAICHKRIDLRNLKLLRSWQHMHSSYWYSSLNSEMPCAGGLFPDQLDPSSSVLIDWLKCNGAVVSDGVEIRASPSGGWGVFAIRDLYPDELSASLLQLIKAARIAEEIVMSMPKTSILSARTTSLTLPLELINARPKNADNPEHGVQTNLTIPTLALVLLHEIRRGSDGEFWGYIQSLPRQVAGLPIFWPKDSEATTWLKGTEAARELRRRHEAHMGLVGPLSIREI